MLVNNAGYGYRAAVEEGEDDAVAQLFATNFFGAVAMIKAVLPGMRARRHGAIVNISSIGAQICPPGSGYYSASKAALEGMSASLRKEVEPLGHHRDGGRARRASAPTSPAAPCSSPEKPSPTTPTPPGADARRTTPHPRQPARRSGPAAQAIIAAVEDPNPPFLLLLGEDALGGFRAVLDARRSELEAWETLSLSTGVSD